MRVWVYSVGVDCCKECFNCISGSVYGFSDLRVEKLLIVLDTPNTLIY